MRDSFIFKTERPWPNERLNLGAAIGHTTATTCRLWTRTDRPGPFTLLLYPEDSDPDDTLFAGFETVPYRALGELPAWVEQHTVIVEDWRRDTTVVFDLDGLAPRTFYRYALHGLDEGSSKGRILLGQDRRHRFRTPADDDGPFSFAFYSCHMPYRVRLFDKTDVVNMQMWDRLVGTLGRHDDLAFAIAGGDQVYTDGVGTLNIWKFLNKVMRREGGELHPGRDAMVTWYRDIYRGYWGFNAVQKAISSFPTYRIWDDHELGDGWGSYYFQESRRKNDLKKILPELEDESRGLSEGDGHELLRRMEEAGKQVYEEYQHGHNPPTPSGQWDYSFHLGSSAFYVLDGRGHRDVNRAAFRILGEEQLDRFAAWVGRLDQQTTRYLFVVSAVPLVHLAAALCNSDMRSLIRKAGLSDDLRDSWEHRLHDRERRALFRALFGAAERGLRVTVLSGDVHTAAVFRLEDPTSGSVLYQLTSSAITYNVSRPLGWILGLGVPDDGETREGYRFERKALYTDSNFSLVKVDPLRDRVVFQLYGEQTVEAPDTVRTEKLGTDILPVSHAIAKIPLEF